MKICYAHTNIIATDWKKLAHFYQEVFCCVLVPPERNQSGKWLEDGTGVNNASLKGVHLRLPGHGNDGPTLEIYQYGQMEDKPTPPKANRKGYGHLAFTVEDVEAIVRKVIENGGKTLGKIVEKEVPSVGMLTFVYVTDPEENIIEVQHWDVS